MGCGRRLRGQRRSRLDGKLTPGRTLKLKPSETQKGAALLLVLIVVVITTLSMVLAHRASLDTLRQARTTLAALRAREAASSGLTVATTGGALSGSLPGGTSWIVTQNTTPSGDRILRSVGISAPPYPATSEILALVDSTGKPLVSPVTVRR